MPEPTITTTFEAYCEPCAWHGRNRSGNMAALNDYDRHVLTAAHQLERLLATIPSACQCDCHEMVAFDSCSICELMHDNL